MNSIFFFFNDTATTEIYTLSLHDALPIYANDNVGDPSGGLFPYFRAGGGVVAARKYRSEEHTSELQSHSDLVCRLLLEKTKNKKLYPPPCHMLGCPTVHFLRWSD